MSEVFHIDKSQRYIEQRDVMIETILKHVRFTRDECLLDAGCGLGEFLESIPTISKVGVDIDPECIETCRMVLPDVDFRVADACNLPFPDGEFDTVTALFLLEHVENPTALIREIRRVTKMGGRALFATPNIGRPQRLFYAAQNKEKWERSGHRQGWDYHLLEHCLSYNGWYVDRIFTRFVDCPFYEWIPRWMGNLISHRILLRLFPRIGSELYALVYKV